VTRELENEARDEALRCASPRVYFYHISAGQRPLESEACISATTVQYADSEPCVASTRKATRIVISHFPQPFCFLLPFQHFEQLDLLQENNYMAFGLRP
jgi:hypothetical protein